MTNVATAEQAYRTAHAEHERLAELKKSLPNGPNKNTATSNFTKSQSLQLAALDAWQKARAAAKAAKTAGAAGARSRKSRKSRKMLRKTRKN